MVIDLILIGDSPVGTRKLKILNETHAPVLA